MAGYGYAYRGNSTYNGVPPRSNEWIKKSYASESDNLSRPVIFDAEGRKRPVILATPNYTAQSYVAKVERVVEHVRVPLVIQYRNSSPPKVVPVKDYGYKVEQIKENEYKAEPVKDYGYKPEPVKEYGYKPEPVKEYGYKPEPVKEYGYKTEPVKEYGYKPEPVKEYGYKTEPVKEYGYKTEPVKEHGYRTEPMKNYGYKAEPVKNYGYKTEPVRDYGYKSEPVKDYAYKTEPNDYGYKSEPMKDYTYKVEPVKEYKVEPLKDNKYADDKWRRPSSPAHDRPREVEDFITNVQTEASRFRRVSPPGASNWPLAQSNRQNGNTGSGDYNNSSNRDWLKPSGNTIRNENNDDYHHKNGNAMEPAMINSGGWVRPSHATWSTPPPTHPDATLGKPTSDIGTAVDNLKDALKPLYLSTPPPRYTVPKRNAYGETIDSKEAVRRNGGANIG